jgi:hypothetical protein
LLRLHITRTGIYSNPIFAETLEFEPDHPYKEPYQDLQQPESG